MLEIKKIESGYDKLQILFGVNMKLDPNEIVVLIGPNGAGKSTVLKSVFNLANIYKGKIIYKNKDITRIPTHELIELGISFVPQGRQVFNTLTVKENLEMGAFLINEKDLVEKKINEVVEHFPDLKKKMNEFASNLSGGQQQMLAIARALMQDPQLLLLDEPSLGLSPKVMKDIFQKIVDINREGAAILIVEQNAKQAVKIADRIYVLEDGKIAMHGDKKILKHEKIKHIYLGGH
ncbi:MAG: ABC transporter ATP-binding protein [Candidatus Woesearchaeota archaeon]|jgi:branched-chain amino acid transport system ATP-binding protein|nr:ABC transporter ATP-binding protein [archaeon]MDP6547872.1 ABC transporter ATP-binding protein [Candidatus Woesearchaeota archaeon]MDP7263101.1 ABC transporter ATP-binding protein [Candidatus Woesearchaeota archaeon]MDP7623184.1 ABC transporter ATP-binding protein [Candidatus Woesearchaeota archaeon]HJN56769.1 ABC transporter ATP-binding protein [Candidatus Woesearchaeota archaeon]|tara:strand:- start:1843 stop:2547 length:705 start_codon:yes stop_codon:yes gene_type:complete